MGGGVVVVLNSLSTNPMRYVVLHLSNLTLYRRVREPIPSTHGSMGTCCETHTRCRSVDIPQRDFPILGPNRKPMRALRFLVSPSLCDATRG